MPAGRNILRGIYRYEFFHEPEINVNDGLR